VHVTEEQIRVALDERARGYGPDGLELPAVVERSRQRRRRRRTVRSATAVLAVAVAAAGGWAAIDHDDRGVAVTASEPDTIPDTGSVTTPTEASAFDQDATGEWRCTPPEPGPLGGTMPAQLLLLLDDDGGLSVRSPFAEGLTTGVATALLDAERLAGFPPQNGAEAADQLVGFVPPWTTVVELRHADGSVGRVPTQPCPGSSARYVAVRLDPTLVGVRFVDSVGSSVIELPPEVVARMAVPSAIRTLQPVPDADRAARWRCSMLAGGVVELARDGVTFQVGLSTVDPTSRWGGPWGGLGDLAAFTPPDVTAVRVEFLDGAVVEVPTHPCGDVRYAALQLASPWVRSITVLGDDPMGAGDDVTPPDMIDPIIEQWYWQGVGTDG
jgi:hypothetical protein